MSNKLTRAFYNTILSQAFSPCGNFLFAGDIYGYLHMFHLSKIMNPDISLTKDELASKHRYCVAPEYQINSLLATKNHLLVGTVSEIHAFTWKNLKGSSLKSLQPSWTIQIPTKTDDFNKAEVNTMLTDEDNKKIYAACGDKIYVFELESSKLLKTFGKHTDYIHSIARNANDFISTGEDGIVYITDLRSFRVSDKIEPNKNIDIARPELGKWIGALDCSDDYILCGGAPRLSLYHYRFLSNATVFPLQDTGIHVASIHKDKIFAGGRSDLFYQTSFNGDIVTEIPTSAVTVYSAVLQEEPFKVLCIAGSSQKIDVSNNFIYRDQQLIVT